MSYDTRIVRTFVYVVMITPLIILYHQRQEDVWAILAIGLLATMETIKAIVRSVQFWRYPTALHGTNRLKYQIYMTKQEYLKGKTASQRYEYRRYIISVIVISMTFYMMAALALLGMERTGIDSLKAGILITVAVFIADLWFSSCHCLLKSLANIIGMAHMKCCGECPVKGWDGLLISITLGIASIRFKSYIEILVGIAILASIIEIVIWEKKKFSIMGANTNCRNCNYASTKVCQFNRRKKHSVVKR
jgi:hypothetical protein